MRLRDVRRWVAAPLRDRASAVGDRPGGRAARGGAGRPLVPGNSDVVPLGPGRDPSGSRLLRPARLDRHRCARARGVPAVPGEDAAAARARPATVRSGFWGVLTPEEYGGMALGAVMVAPRPRLRPRRALTSPAGHRVRLVPTAPGASSRSRPDRTNPPDGPGRGSRIGCSP